MNEQLSLFEMLDSESKAHGDFRNMEEQELVGLIGDSLGITFIYDPRLDTWIFNRNKLKMTCRLSHYSCDGVNFKEGDPFISCGYDYKTSGGGYPCDSIDEAVRRLTNVLETYG